MMKESASPQATQKWLSRRPQYLFLSESWETASDAYGLSNPLRLPEPEPNGAMDEAERACFLFV